MRFGLTVLGRCSRCFPNGYDPRQLCATFFLKAITVVVYEWCCRSIWNAPHTVALYYKCRRSLTLSGKRTPTSTAAQTELHTHTSPPVSLRCNVERTPLWHFDVTEKNAKVWSRVKCSQTGWWRLAKTNNYGVHWHFNVLYIFIVFVLYLHVCALVCMPACTCACVCACLQRLTHFHVLWAEAHKGPQKVVLLVALQGLVVRLLLLRVHLRLPPPQQLLQFSAQRPQCYSEGCTMLPHPNKSLYVYNINIYILYRRI